MKFKTNSRRRKAIKSDQYLHDEKQARYRHALKNGFNKDYCASGYKRFSKEEIAEYEAKCLNSTKS